MALTDLVAEDLRVAHGGDHSLALATGVPAQEAVGGPACDLAAVERLGLRVSGGKGESEERDRRACAAAACAGGREVIAAGNTAHHRRDRTSRQRRRVQAEHRLDFPPLEACSAGGCVVRTVQLDTERLVVRLPHPRQGGLGDDVPCL